MSVLNDAYLNRLGVSITEKIKEAIRTKNLTGYGPSVASGELLNSVRYELKDNELNIYAKAYIGALQNGRKPTTGNAGNPTLKEAIRDWIDDKGINPEDISKDSLAYLIARKIHREGTLLYRKNNGGSSGLLDDVINENLVEDIKKELLLYYVESYRSEIKNVLK